MARRRLYLPRPLDSLHAAAKTHGALTTGEPHEPALEEQAPIAQPHHTESQPRDRQARDAKGRFT